MPVDGLLAFQWPPCVSEDTFIYGGEVFLFAGILFIQEEVWPAPGMIIHRGEGLSQNFCSEFNSFSANPPDCQFFLGPFDVMDRLWVGITSGEK